MNSIIEKSLYYEECSNKTYFIKNYYKERQLENNNLSSDDCTIFQSLFYKSLEWTLGSEVPGTESFLYKKEAYDLEGKLLKIIQFSESGKPIKALGFSKTLENRYSENLPYNLLEIQGPYQITNYDSSGIKRSKYWYNDIGNIYQYCKYIYEVYPDKDFVSGSKASKDRETNQYLYLINEEYFVDNKLVLKIFFIPAYTKILDYNCPVEYLYFNDDMSLNKRINLESQIKEKIYGLKYINPMVNNF
jgi:hypothetical protein